jgi:ABC-2 type transport system ATP-binding protein
MTAMSADFAIDLQNVSKIYRRKVHALTNVSMQVHRGEIFGLLGPNGAGKSTLVKIMMTVVRATKASGMLLGKPIGHKPTLQYVGYLPENHRFPKYLTGRQVVEFFSALSNVDRLTRRKRAAELVEKVGMAEWADTKISQYSKGMMQRIGLAQSLGADPQLVVLDEPTDGVDPAGRRDIRDMLSRLRQEGKTVFVNSHLLSELEVICDRVAIMVRGQVMRQGTIDQLALGRHFFLFEISNSSNGQPLNIQQNLNEAMPGIFQPNGQAMVQGKLPDGTWCDFDGKNLRIGKSTAEDVQPIMDSLRQRGIIIRRMQLQRPTLEDMFIEAVEAKSGKGAN